MGIRNALNRYPALAGGVTVLIALAAVAYAVHVGMGPGRDKPATRAFFSTDDGKTWFADDIKRIPPFKTADGKEAVQVVVVSCKGGSDPFVTYLWRYTPEGKALVEQGKGLAAAMMKELKKPGQSEWVKQGDFAKAGQVTMMVCPPGQNDLVAIDP